MIDNNDERCSFILQPTNTYNMRIAYGAITISGIQKQPNRFHRIMYRLLLGIEWGRDD